MTLDEALLDHGASRWARFLGSNLPPRTLGLAFDLPIPYRRPTRAELSPDKARERYAALAQNRRAQLTLAVEHIRTVNRSRVAPKQRFAVAEAALVPVVATARELVAEIYEAAGGVPEHAGRRERLEVIGGALQTLLAAYRTVFRCDYEKRPFAYARARRRVHLCAHRILELILMLQQARALRYQPLEGGHWRTANTVFRVMLDYEQVDVPLETVGPLLGTRRSRDARSLRDLYAGLQVPWLLDFPSWPETLFPFALDYCRALRDCVVFLPEGDAPAPQDRGPAPDRARPLAWTACLRDREPGAARGPDREGAALAIDCSLLAEAAQADFDALRKAREAQDPGLVPRRFAPIEPASQLAAAYLMARFAARDPHPEAPAAVPGDFPDLRVHAGFQEVFAHLQAIFDPDGRLAAGRELSDLFAQRSAAIGEDHTAVEASLWHVLQETGGRLRLQTQETRFTHRLTIGSFLAYGVGEAGIRCPRLGKVARISRPDSGMVMVDVLEFADYARPVGVRHGESGAGSPVRRGDLVRALLAYHEGSGWSILLPEQTRFWEHVPVRILGGAQELHLELGELRDLGEGYCLFRLKARIEAGQRPHYPEPATSGPADHPEGPGLAALGRDR